jgi:hypothetical protein
MSEYKLVTDTIEVPPNTGVDGFLYTLRELLKLPRLQSVKIDAKGKVTYERYIREDEKAPIGVDFADLEPWHIIRNAPVQEVRIRTSNPATALLLLFDSVRMEGYQPAAFVTGANTTLRYWLEMGTGQTLQPSMQTLFGVPIYTDRNCPDSVLVLCGAYTSGAPLVDTQKSYKIEMELDVVPETVVEIL